MTGGRTTGRARMAGEDRAPRTRRTARVGPMARLGRIVAMAITGGALVGGLGVGGGAPVSAQTGAAKWKVGDCFAAADVDADRIDLTSKVACARPHEVQVLAGAPVPAPLARLSYTDVGPTSRSAARRALADFAAQTCTPAAVIGAVYPEHEELVPLLARHGAREAIPPGPGRLGWVIDDPAAFGTGSPQLLCVFEVDPGPYGGAGGDLRDLGTRAALPKFRLCYDFTLDEPFVSCAKPHEEEALMFLVLDVSGRPAQLDDWQDADWAPYDDTCADFAEVLIGRARKDVRILADSSPEEPARDNARLFSCRAVGPEKGDRLPAGTVVGLGGKKIKITPATSKRK